VVIRITTYRKERRYEPREIYWHGRPPSNDLGCGHGFARRFLPEINPSEKQSHQVVGFDGISNLDSVKVPQVDLQVGGTTVRIAPVQVLLKETTSDSNWYFGRIGIDLLGRARQVNLNFKTMTLELR
jgi:hypothetical protein